MGADHKLKRQKVFFVWGVLSNGTMAFTLVIIKHRYALEYSLSTRTWFEHGVLRYFNDFIGDVNT